MERYGFDASLGRHTRGWNVTDRRSKTCVVSSGRIIKCRGDLEDASRKIVHKTFERDDWDPFICLQLAPTSEMDDGQTTSVQLQQKKSKQQDWEQLELELQVKRQE
jgi:hypothetical protein